jgi:chromosome partitioning protein
MIYCSNTGIKSAPHLYFSLEDETEAKQMHKILVVNSKGGAGKSTLCSNLAAYYANWGINTYVADMDPQKSVETWLKHRPRDVAKVHLAKNGLRDLKPEDAEYLIVDTPAGLSGIHLNELIRMSDTILIPVLPSPFDIHTTGEFIYKILSDDVFDANRQKIAVIANRVKLNTNMFQSLKEFLMELEIPFLTVLRDSQNYVKALVFSNSIARPSKKTLNNGNPFSPG